MAGEDAATARRVARPGWSERAGDRQGLDVRQPGPVEGIDGASKELLQAACVADRQVANEGDAYRSGPRLHMNGRGEAGLDPVARVLRFLEHHRQVVVAADRGNVDTLPIDRRLDLVRIVQP